MNAPLRRGAAWATLALLTSSATLVCCVLPAIMVALGSGAALAGLVGAFPQLVWLSEHKVLVFGTATTTLSAAGVLLWRARSQPCPADPRAARACVRLRRTSAALYAAALLAFAIGAAFAFGLPLLAR